MQSKTGHTHTVQFRAETLRLIESSMSYQPARRLIWPLWCGRDRWYGHFRRLRLAAGLDCGTSRWIRRSSVSYVERDQPGRASQHLGHRSPELAARYYLDRRIVGAEPTIPPDF